MEDDLLYSLKFIDSSEYRTDTEKFIIKTVLNEENLVPIRFIYEDDNAEFEMTFTDDKSGYVHKHIRKPNITECTIKPWSIDTSFTLTLEIYKSLFIGFMGQFDTV